MLALSMYLNGAIVCAQQTVPDPNDPTKPYLSIFTHADYAARPSETDLVRNIQSGRMLQFARSSHFKHYTTADPLYRERFAAMFPESTLPVICVQRHDGAYWYKASGNRIPQNADALMEEIEFYVKLDPALDTQTKEQICPPGQPCPPTQPPFTPPNMIPELPYLPDSGDITRVAPLRDAAANMAYVAFAIIAAIIFFFVLVAAIIVLVIVSRPQSRV
jgi:hypothetical protein